MFRLMFLVASFFILSCDNNNIKEIIKIEQNKNNIQNNNTDNSSFFSNIEKFKELKDKFKNNNENVFIQGYFDNDNNAMIFFENKLYILNKNSELKIIHDLGEYSKYIYSRPILDKNGNGLNFYTSETGGSFDVYMIKKFENFIPTESLIIRDPYVIVPDINELSYNNYIGQGYSFEKDENKELIFFDINGFFKYNESGKFRLENNEKFQSIILNKNNNGFIFTKEDPVATIYTKENPTSILYTYKSYLIKNNSIDLKNGKILFLKDSYERYITGKIDDYGNGYIYYNNKENNIELKKIFNYNIEEKSLFYNNIKLRQIKLNSDGNGFMITGEMNNLFFNEVKNYNLTDNKIIISNSLDKMFIGKPIYLINEHGNGFILLSSYKNIRNPYLPDSKENKTTFTNDIIFVKDYKIVK
ncbi:MAG: hypothetical protein AABZ74_03695 [Cyanobacteriota bacterium]